MRAAAEKTFGVPLDAEDEPVRSGLDGLDDPIR